MNGILRVTIPPGAGWECARGPRAIAQVRTKARDTLYRIVTDIRPFNPRPWVGRMDFMGLLAVLHVNRSTWAADVQRRAGITMSNDPSGRILLGVISDLFVGIRRAHRIACLTERSYVSRC